MEKLDYLSFREIDTDALRPLADRVRGLTVYAALDLERAPLLMGQGAELRGLVSVWLDSLDDRGALEAAIPGAHGYLVTESVPQLPGPPAAVIHVTWFPKPDRLTAAEFFHGWHDVHTPSTWDLHPRRTGYIRDSVARPLTPDAPRVDAIVFEHFPEVEDYTDPKRLFGSKEALEETSRHLSSFADLETISSRPMSEEVLKQLSGS